jgi:hypothetical protein
LYNEKLSQGLFADLQKGIYLSNNFRDYVYIGLAIKKPEWVVDLVNKYYNELPEEFREDEIKLYFAKLDISKNNYEKSLLNLNDIKDTNYLVYMDSSTLKLCCYYELGMYEEAYLELDKLKHYIRNHKEIPKVHYSFNAVFIQIYHKLLKIVTEPHKEKDIGYLEKELYSLGVVTKKEWLLEKILEIKN